MAKKAHQARSKVGWFMVAAGAVIEHSTSQKILVVKRSKQNDFRDGEWELVYGRVDQGESLEMGLAREIAEEVGIKKFEIIDQLRTWHIFRGEKKPEHELIGLTFWVQVNSDKVILSSEHDEFRWVEPAEAIKLITQEGIKEDVELFELARQNKVEAENAIETARRALADYKNLIRRTEKERNKLVKLSTLDLIKNLLQPFEHLNIAAEQIKDRGVKMVADEFRQVLADHGLVEIKALGEDFDVETMEVVEREGKGKKVLKVIRRGYMLNGEVIQHAKVVVG